MKTFAAKFGNTADLVASGKLHLFWPFELLFQIQFWLRGSNSEWPRLYNGARSLTLALSECSNHSARPGDFDRFPIIFKGFVGRRGSIESKMQSGTRFWILECQFQILSCYVRHNVEFVCA